MCCLCVVCLLFVCCSFVVLFFLLTRLVFTCAGAVDETNRDADQRVKRAIDDAKKAQNAVFEQRQEMSRMEDELQQAQKAQAIAEAAFAAVDATEIGEEDIMGSSSRGGRNNDYARGSAASAARVMRKNTNASLDDSYGADDFSDDNYGSDFD